MPSKSRRDKIVSLTVVKKKGSNLKTSVIKNIRDYLTQYQNIYVFIYDNLKAKHVNKIRQSWQSKGRLNMAKNKVIAYALGKTASEEYHKNLHLVSETLTGRKALLFTDSNEEQVKIWLKKYLDQIEDEITFSLESRWSKDGVFRTYNSE